MATEAGGDPLTSHGLTLLVTDRAHLVKRRKTGLTVKSDCTYKRVVRLRVRHDPRLTIMST
jgi:hypothetical protein